MVRTLANAIATGRIAHAFILTGVRGVGKTTTARIIARALNCIGPDGTGGPTTEPCGECAQLPRDRRGPPCRRDRDGRRLAHRRRRHPRLDRRRALSAGLGALQGLHHRRSAHAVEERLQRAVEDARRAAARRQLHLRHHRSAPRSGDGAVALPALLAAPRADRAARRCTTARSPRPEGIAIAPAALGLIARAADGSVRDGLSLLDQAIALSGGTIEEAAVRDMLGIADRGLVFDLFETVMRGDAAGALDRMDSLYQGGADPLMVLQDLLDLAHFVTRLKLAPEAGAGDPLEEGERERARPLAAAAGDAGAGARLADAAEGPGRDADGAAAGAGRRDGPGAARLCRRPAGPGRPGAGAARRPASRSPARGGRPASHRHPFHQRRHPRPAIAGETPAVPTGGPSALAIAPPAATPSPALAPMPQSFAEVVALFDSRREALIRSHLWSHLHLVAFEPGRIEFRPDRGGAARSRQPARPAARRVDRCPLDRRGLAGRRRADAGGAGGAARQPAQERDRRATRWCRRCWRPSPAPRSRRCASVSRRPRTAPSRRRTRPAMAISATVKSATGRRARETRNHEESRPVDETGPADAGEDGRDAGAARSRRDDRRGRRRHGAADAQRQGRREAGQDRPGGGSIRRRSRYWKI